MRRRKEVELAMSAVNNDAADMHKALLAKVPSPRALRWGHRLKLKEKPTKPNQTLHRPPSTVHRPPQTLHPSPLILSQAEVSAREQQLSERVAELEDAICRFEEETGAHRREAAEVTARNLEPRNHKP
jgi:hypothetical protein